MKSALIRQHFLDFFKNKLHQIVPSAPIVVKNDPTLMFTNAGMNQFKDYFLGNKMPDNKRIADTQKCLRVSGKHNDLEEVGVDTYHHTMFEMLGNWSFGDYFKKEAIEWAWELLTKIYKLNPENLYVTYFEGDTEENLVPDAEALECWKQWIDEDRIIPAGKKDNFWEMGDTGPCGPCSEIHIDLRDENDKKTVSGKSLVNAGHPQVVEIWNLVFIQFNRKADSSLESLPQNHVDTGMGFERLCMALQGKRSNYDTDVFSPIIEKISAITQIPYGKSEKTDIAIRVLADHIRAISFTIADGQLPSNTGAGYVIRRILRRAVRYAYSVLNYQQAILHQLVPVLAQQFKEVFPELALNQSFVQKVVLEEENAFLRTLEAGLKRFELLKHQNIDGEAAFELYDTYGFPFDLTKLMASEANIAVDETGFMAAMEKQKARSRAATQLKTDDWVNVQANTKGNTFVGYNLLQCPANILRYRKIEQKKKTYFQLVLDQTPFYAESGGQIGDTGQLIFPNEIIEIIDTQKENDLIVHFCEKLPEDVERSFIAQVDSSRRQAIASNHSATHLLHAALRQTLGTHVHQKGSLVAPDHLRFDFAHFAKVNEEELAQIEQIVNDKIRENIALQTDYLPYEKAVESGAMALFGEKYADVVRVVSFDPKFSRELCGGTHVRASGEIGLFKFITETSVAAGVRRIEAVTANTAYNLIAKQYHELQQIKSLLKNTPDLTQAVSQVLNENSQLQKEVEKMQLEKALDLRKELLQNAQRKNDLTFVAAQVAVPNADILKQLTYDLKNSTENLVAVLAAEVEGKALISVMIEENLLEKHTWNAGTLVREWAKIVQGGGGGQAFYATAGGKNPAAIPQLIQQAKSWFENEN
ncbi:MAG: alanine--tRNA ligase [Chitinophagales bacterium]|nr:alanine--tRNA ligase [Bacteroidota bacterium]MCB9043188.1 alanine--tRNA ligase [Chitinophagales bacterium]